MKNIDSRPHLRGESIYVNDIPVREGTLYGAVFGSPRAHGRILSVDFTKALACPGVTGIVSARDIPGENQIGGIIPDEELFADHLVEYYGMPVAVVLADTEDHARRALKHIRIEIEELPPVLTARQAHANGQLLIPPRTFACGDVASAWAACETIVEGQVEMGGQEHVYLETQGVYAHPLEHGGLKVYSATQSTRYVQRGISRVLGLPMHKIEVETNRIGGGFGGKEDQGTPWACMAALAVVKFKCPVKLILSRADDIEMTGKRHPYSFDFRMGLTKDLKIHCYEVTAYQNAGASSDVSPAVMERTLFHGTSAYFVPNASTTCYSCKTNLPPNTAFRGFGAPQAMFAMESAILKAAVTLGVDPSEIQRRNLIQNGDEFPYGQVARNCGAVQSWDTAVQHFEVERLQAEVATFNQENQLFKKGLALFPLAFGISFTKTSLNQGRALVHLYVDGSVSVTTGVIEMGQGVNTKIVEAAARTLSIHPDRITIHSTNTTRVANPSPTAASSGADLNGKATINACLALLARLRGVACQALRGQDPMDIELRDEVVYHRGQPTDLTWPRLIVLMDEARISPSEMGHYATPVIHFNNKLEKGHPFAYHVYGTAVTVATVDCLRGTYVIDAVHIIHDFGASMNMELDLGQVEGGLVQGIGLMTIEELLVGPNGKNVYDALSSYKVPDLYFAPRVVEIEALDTKPDDLALLGSKAVGEPPLMYGIGSYFAILKAMRAFNPGLKLELSAPLTHQKCLMSLYDNYGDLLK